MLNNPLFNRFNCPKDLLVFVIIYKKYKEQKLKIIICQTCRVLNTSLITKEGFSSFFLNSF